VSKTIDEWNYAATAIPDRVSPFSLYKAFNCGVDAVTVSYRDDSRVAFEEIRAATRRAVSYRMDGSFETRSARLRGYEGERPHPSMFVGSMAGQGTLVVATGSLSEYVVDELRDADHCARIDLQLTLWVSQDADTLISKARDYADSFRKAPGRLGRPFSIRHEQTLGSGDTLYLGSRTSERFGRIYNKGAESGELEYSGSIRYEVELKNDAATRFYRRYVATTDPTACLLSEVLRDFSEWGIHLPTNLADKYPKRIEATPDPFSAERKLEWLRNGVSGTVDKLLDEGVEFEAIYDALFGKWSARQTPNAPLGPVRLPRKR
jgi:hypothetical protein